MDVDVVPVREFPGDDLRGLGIVARDVVDREVGEDHAPTEGDAWRIAFEDRDVVRRIAQLHRDGEVEAGGTGADAGDLHGMNPTNFTKFTPSFAREGTRERSLSSR